MYMPFMLHCISVVALGNSLLCSASADNLAGLRGLLLYYFIKHLAEREDSYPISSFEETLDWWEKEASIRGF